jgi:phage tail-like protein
MRIAARNVYALLAGLVMTIAAVERPNAAPPSSTVLSAVRFELTIDGHSLASFSELVGISSTATVPSSPSSVSAVGAPLGSPTVTLRRGMTRNIEIAAWHELVILGDVTAARRSVSLTAYDIGGRPVARYHLTDAYPSKLEITTLKAGASEVLMETVTMTCAFVQRVSV